MRLQRTCAGLATAALCVLSTTGVAGATHGGGGSSGPPQDFSSGSFKGEIPSLETRIHARYTGHLPAVQSASGAFDVRGEAVVDLDRSSGERTKHRGDLLCGTVDGHRAFLLYTLREPVTTGFGPARHMALLAFDNGRPNEQPSDDVGIAFIVFGGPPPEESRRCSTVGVLFEHTHGNVVVHDGQP